MKPIKTALIPTIAIACAFSQVSYADNRQTELNSQIIKELQTLRTELQLLREKSQQASIVANFDRTAECIFENKLYSRNMIITVNGVKHQCRTNGSNNLSWEMPH